MNTATHNPLELVCLYLADFLSTVVTPLVKCCPNLTNATRCPALLALLPRCKGVQHERPGP